MTTQDSSGDSPSRYDAVIASDRQNVWHHLTQHKMLENNDPMVIVKGDGMRVTDANGKQYLDATSGGVWTVNVGYGRKEIAEAVRDQLEELCFFAHTAGNIPAAQMAEQLIDKMPGMSRVYFTVSGSEANEKAYKMVRQIGHAESGGMQHKIIYRRRDYHGTTISALSSSGQPQRREQYGPFTPGFVEMPSCYCYRCPFGQTYGSCNIECAHELENVIKREGAYSVAAVVLESITAGGGVIVPVPEYFPIIQDICRRYGVLLHLDEVVCGLGRTGKWFGYEHFNVKPDLVTLAKGVASGYAAIGCTVTSEAVFDKFKANPSDPMSYFRDISTYGGCTSGPAAAVANMQIIERENLLENAATMGAYLLERLHELQSKHTVVGDVRGIGLLAGIELVRNRDTKEPVSEIDVVDITARCLQEGLIVGRTNRSFDVYNNTLTLCPALIVTRSEIDEMVDIMDRSLGAYA